jgi:hypothetical protein
MAALDIGVEARGGDPIQGWWPIAYDASGLKACHGCARR